MPKESPHLRERDTLSSISLYIGIPTQEYRTIQGNLTRLIGNVLRLAHKHQKEEGEGNTYMPLIEGASAYISVFGHWVSQNDYSSRVDDHSEVVEFFMSPDDYYPTLLLILCEVAYPALLLANQDAILMLLEHDSAKHRVMLWKQSKAGSISRLAKNTSLSMEREINDNPLQCLKYLLSILVESELGEEELHDYGLSLNWLRFDSEDAIPLYKGFRAGWKRWLKVNRGEELYKSVEDQPGPSTYYLPTIYIRILLNVACWWIFYSASQTIKDGKDGLWAPSTGKIIIKLLQRELEHLEQTYFSPQTGDTWRRVISLESDDPLANALLWLAFVHDFLAHSLNSSEFNEQGGAQSGISLRGHDPLHPSSSVEPPTEKIPLKFDEFMKKILRSSLINPPNDNDHQSISYWKRRLDFLEKLNDRYFPDDHLLSAWRFLLGLIETPRIALSNRSDKGCTRLSNRSDEDRTRYYSVKWADWLCTKSKAQGPDMWVKLNRTLREAPAIAKLWTAPLTTEAIFAFATLGRNSRKWNIKRMPSLKTRLDQLYVDRTQGVSTIVKMARDATAGYPVKLTKPSADPDSLSSFIYHMQSQQ